MQLFWVIFWAAVFVMIVVGGGLLYTVFRFRRKDDRMPEQTHGNTKLEIAWTIAPAIVLAIVAVPTVTTQFYISDTPSGDVMQVNVTAHQWWWEFEYPDTGVHTANEFHVPEDTVIESQHDFQRRSPQLLDPQAGRQAGRHTRKEPHDVV